MSRKKADIQPVDGAEMTDRSRNRWLLMFYDSILYLFCWLVIFIVRPLWGAIIPGTALYPYMGIGYVLFFGLRLAMKCYRKILRYGSIHVFARELAAGVGAAILLLIVNLLMEIQFHAADSAYNAGFLRSRIYPAQPGGAHRILLSV